MGSQKRWQRANGETQRPQRDSPSRQSSSRCLQVSGTRCAPALCGDCSGLWMLRRQQNWARPPTGARGSQPQRLARRITASGSCSSFPPGSWGAVVSSELVVEPPRPSWSRGPGSRGGLGLGARMGRGKGPRCLPSTDESRGQGRLPQSKCSGVERRWTE